ncbi:MAG TPA: hypothetical protein VNT81_18105 [Vicinamibacterales bacterium]|nr:hypothetical protein [Vicinamibacterales bacterium]
MKVLLLAVTLSLFQNPAGVPAESAPLAQFSAEIETYMAIRLGLLNEVSGPQSNSTAVQLNQASDALSAAIRRRRPNAKPGMLFTPEVAEALTRRLNEAVRRENLAPVLARIDDEDPGTGKPSIYQRFPAGAQLATMPPALLAVLPTLPKELEYRIVGTYLVLRDVDAALVLDFIPGAVPRK